MDATEALKEQLKCGRLDMACRLVEQGRYLSVLPLYAVRTAAESGAVRILPMQGERQLQFVQIVLHENKVILPQLKGWMEEVKTVLEQTAARI